MSGSTALEKLDLGGRLRHHLGHQIYARWGCLYCRIGHIRYVSRQDRRRAEAAITRSMIPGPRAWTKDDRDQVLRSDV